jgi:hypothetical protein
VKPVIVSLAWGDEYHHLADRLALSAKEHGLDCLITRHPGPVAPNGLDAWRQKAACLLQAVTDLQLEGKNAPLLWVDVDFIVEGYPSLFDQVEADVLAYCNGNRPGVYEDGVIYFADSEAAHEVICRWAARCELDQVKWTSDELSVAILKSEAKVGALPPEYHWVERWKMSGQYGRNRKPVIREVPLGFAPAGCCGD